MKQLYRWLILLSFGLGLVGCGQLAKESEFWDHSSMYKNWGHMFYSMGGYKKCDVETARRSAQEGWWGIAMPCGASETALPVKDKESPAVKTEKEKKKPEAPKGKKKTE